MQVSKFVELLQKAKPSTRTTGTMNLVAGVTENRLTVFVRMKSHSDAPEEVTLNGQLYRKVASTATKLKIEFVKPHVLTVFESEMLWLLMIENKRCFDYAGYHNCQAGKEFIENIKSMEVLR